MIACDNKLYDSRQGWNISDECLPIIYATFIVSERFDLYEYVRWFWPSGLSWSWMHEAKHKNKYYCFVKQLEYSDSYKKSKNKLTLVHPIYEKNTTHSGKYIVIIFYFCFRFYNRW